MRSTAPVDVRKEDDSAPLNPSQLREVAHLHQGVFVFYLLDGLLLTVFALLGSVPMSSGFVYTFAGWLTSAVTVRAFRRGRVRPRDLETNNFVMSGCAVGQMLVTSILLPAVGSLLLMSLMTVLAAAALQLSMRRLVVLALGCASAAGLTLTSSPKPFELPMDTTAEGIVSAVWFGWLLAKCALINVAGTRLRQHASRANARLHKALGELRTLAATDELTVIANRRSIVADLHKAIESAAKAPETVAVALFDIDHFKAVNDRHGHAVGDTVLREFAALLARGLRPSDSVGRYGGEEFLLVLQQVKTLGDARETAERMRKAVESFDWQPIGDGLQLTASAGVVLVGIDEAAAASIARADAALYRAKAGGRNQVALG